MDLGRFELDLAQAVATELLGKRSALAERVLRSLALDVHPWHGRIGLSALTDRDPEYADVVEQREEMASWQLFDLPAEGTGRWRRVAALEAWMRETHGHEPALQAAVLAAAARALDHEIVTAALLGYRLAPTFERFVGHPDDRAQRNLCRSAG